MDAHLSDTLINELAEAGPEAELDEAVSRHLALCEPCRRELALARAVTEALNAVPRMVAPPELLEGVMSRLAGARRVSQRTTMAWAATAALATFALVVLWLVAGGAATLTIETLEAVRSLDLVTRVASSVWRTIPLELFFLCTVLLVAASVGLRRLVSRAERGPRVEVEAS